MIRYVLVFSLLTLLSAVAEEKIDFNRQVRPILSDKCFACHGPDAHDIKGGLQLHTLELATKKLGKKKNRQALVPGDVSKSVMWERMITDDEDDIMPPPESHKKLKKEEMDILKKWIEQGAKYDEHWAYKEISSSENLDIDKEVEKALKAKGLKLNEEADKRTLIRRLSYDLRGLPPTRQEIDQYLADKSPKSWENLVDRFLADKHYGERMAVFWLDLVRFADTVGYHGDQNQKVYPYRDYVINAFNSNKKFDEFTRQQLAGDMLTDGDKDENLVASCFNRLNMMTQEGGAQPKEYLAKYGADRVRTFGNVFMGSTTGCCECHDHKYDPFTAKDFYSLKAFFADIKQVGRYGGNHAPTAKIKDKETYPKFEKLDQQKKSIQQKQNALIAKAKKDPEVTKQAEKLKLEGNVVNTKSHKGATLKVRPDRSILVSGKVPETDIYEVQLDLAKPSKSIVLEVLLDKAVKAGFALKSGNFVLTFVEILDSKGKAVKINNAEADYQQRGFAVKDALRKNEKGWAVDGHQAKLRANRVARFNLKNSVSGKVTVKLHFNSKHKFHQFACFRLSGGINASFQALASMVKSGSAVDVWLATQPEYKKNVAELKRIDNEMKAINYGMSEFLVTERVTPVVTKILPRGNWQDDSGEVVEPAIPAFLGKINKEGRANRLDLANWLVDKNNPLTSRVYANRMWKILFGKGLSEIVEDLGSQGQTPYYVNVLDSLANSFRQDWDVKKLIKRIVMTKVYKQAASVNPKVATMDPFNLMLSHQNNKRLDAEFIRDGLLAASGLLNRKMFGRSVKPYQPAGHYSQLNFPRRTYKADYNDNQYRRGVYMHWQRTFLHPMLQAFDAPTREESCARRSVSNTPLQALVLLNDPTFVEAAKAMADNALATKQDDAAMLTAMFENVTSRLPSSQEQTVLLDYLKKQKAFFAKNPNEAVALLTTGMYKTQASGANIAAWTSVARIILNLHESVTVY